MPWSVSLESEEPFDYPFHAQYEIDTKSLTYLATLHENSESSETFKNIKHQIENNHIDCIILEGFPFSLGYSPANMSNWAEKQGSHGVYDGFETAYSIKLADINRVKYIGAEPETHHIFEKVLQNGFSSKDIVYYFFVQQVFQNKCNSSLTEDQIESFFQSNISKYKEYLDYLPEYSDFLSWYMENNHETFCFGSLTDSVPAPYQDGNLLTQRISSAVCIARDQFIVSVINDIFNKFSKVVVIFGGSHWSTQKKALENAYGKPKVYKS